MPSRRKPGIAATGAIPRRPSLKAGSLKVLKFRCVCPEQLLKLADTTDYRLKVASGVRLLDISRPATERPPRNNSGIFNPHLGGFTSFALFLAAGALVSPVGQILTPASEFGNGWFDRLDAILLVEAEYEHQS